MVGDRSRVLVPEILVLLLIFQKDLLFSQYRKIDVV